MDLSHLGITSAIMEAMKSRSILYLLGIGTLVSGVSLAIGISLGSRRESDSANKKVTAILQASKGRDESRRIAHKKIISLVEEWQDHRSSDQFLSQLKELEIKYAYLGEEASWWSNEARLMVTADVQQEQALLQKTEASLLQERISQLENELRRQLSSRSDIGKAIKLLDDFKADKERSSNGLPRGMERSPTGR